MELLYVLLYFRLKDTYERAAIGHFLERKSCRETQIYMATYFKEYLDWNYIPNIINFVVIPVFSQLRILNVGGNNIVSI
jgi:hypothetical protein